MKKEIKEKLWIFMIIVLIVLTIISGYYAFKLKEKYTILTNNSYNEAFSSLVNYINNIGEIDICIH